ncbi:trigger factor, partial [Frankliniella occidentalis]|uniref:Trigger factor n=1 Tax=Frankliniella occidentalis TaxID=133901 RepID=A0A9C6XCR3_FRAOC
MGKDYPTALKYCKLILQYEPNNRTARDFYPLIVEKLVQSTIDEARTDSEDDSSSSGGSGSLSGSDDTSSDLSEEDDDDDEEDEDGDDKQVKHNDNSSVEYGDTDGTTASYSSLEDEEAEPETGTGLGLGLGLELHLANDNEDAGNGNEVPVEANTTDKLLNRDETGLARFSDSESPTEPVSQRLITELRGRVVVA